jgi:hypothetical protein
MAGKGRTSIFTKLFKDHAKRTKAIARAGGDAGKKGKRIKVSPTIKKRGK